MALGDKEKKDKKMRRVRWLFGELLYPNTTDMMLL
jgi:hypothetical protein